MGKITAAFLLFVITGAGLVFVFSPIFDLGWIGKPPSEKVSFYVTGVGVPLLTFAGFLAVLLGFLAQQEQNELQERQLENQREQIEAQQDNFEKDRFESTFFQLLRTHNQIVKDISCGGGRFSGSGRNCFKMFFESFKCSLEENGGEDADSVGPDEVLKAYEEWYENEKSILNHYFNNLTKIISFVDESDAFPDESTYETKQFYIDLIIAQMSVPELVLFFYHEAAMRGRKEYVEGVYDLLGEYTFFDQIDPKRSLIHERHRQLHPRALGE